MRRRRRLAVGNPILPETLQAFPTALEATRFMRDRALSLKDMFGADVAAPEYGPLGVQPAP